MPILNRSKTLIAIAVELLDKHGQATANCYASYSGGIIKLLLLLTASHTDVLMLTSVALERAGVLAVFCGADR
jgi:hypothetical protein